MAVCTGLHTTIQQEREETEQQQTMLSLPRPCTISTSNPTSSCISIRYSVQEKLSSNPQQQQQQPQELHC
jgi:hypothetical protein